MVECPKCGGYGYDGVDECGCPYTCYRCCETGFVTLASYEQELREEEQAKAEAEAEAIARRKEYGVPDGWGYRLDEYEGVILIPPRPAPGAKPAVVDYSDDIPF
jgi:hypothetical protein